MAYKLFLFLILISFSGIPETTGATPVKRSPIPPIAAIMSISAAQEIGYHNTPIPKNIKNVALSKKSSVGVYIENPNPGKSFQIQAIKARIQASRGKKGTIKLHLYEFSEDRTISEDLLKNQYMATVDENGAIRTFPIKNKVTLKGAGILVVVQWMGGAQVQIPAGETTTLKSNVNYNIPNPDNIGAGTKAAQILKHQVLDTEHPLTIGLVIE